MGLHDALIQIIIVGCIAFTCPGFFNALTGLGGAGNANPTAGNQANTALYACFAVVGYFGGPLYSIFGNRILMFVGGLTYALYAAGMYIVGKVEGSGWVAPLVGAILGVGAALFWTSQGAMMMAYATPANKGKYISVFWAIFNLGGTIGGIIQFALNYNAPRALPGEDESGNTASAASYFTFIAVMCAGSIATLFFVVKPSTVRKEDGSDVVFEKRPALEEIKGAIMVVTHPTMLLLTMTFLASNWFYTYQLNYLNGFLFTIRSRGINSAFYWGSQMFAAWITGLILDISSWSKKKRAIGAYLLSTVTLGAFWILAFCVNYAFEDHYDKGSLIYRIDITDSQRASLPIFAFIFAAIGDASMQTFCYWLMGTLAGNDSNLSARFSGYYKGIQSAGAAIAWALDTSDAIKYSTQLIISCVLFAVAYFLQIFAIRRIKEEEPGQEKADDQEEQQKSIAVAEHDV